MPWNAGSGLGNWVPGLAAPWASTSGERLIPVSAASSAASKSAVAERNADCLGMQWFLKNDGMECGLRRLLEICQLETECNLPRR